MRLFNENSGQNRNAPRGVQRDTIGIKIFELYNSGLYFNSNLMPLYAPVAR